MASQRVERRLAAILVADVAGYGWLTSMAEEDTHVRLKEHLRILIDPKITDYHGRVVKNTGDGMLAEFNSVVDALRCAVEVQRGMAERNTNVPEEKRIEFRIGVNVGDVIIDSGDIFGHGVNVAVRLEGIARPGGICVSERVREYAQDQLDVLFEDAGEHQLKNIARPLRAYRVRFDRPANIRPALTVPSKPSIAVLPFENLSGDPEQEYFADGMAEEIITALSRLRWLFVIARNSSFTYKGRAENVSQVGRELGVRYVLEGSVRKSGDRVRILGQPIDASTGAHLWADRFEGHLKDVFELQDRVTASVVGAIAPKLEQVEIDRARRKPTESLDAYDYYRRGISCFHRGHRQDLSEALELFQKAIDLDSDFACAYGMAAWCVCVRSGHLLSADFHRETAGRLARHAARLGQEDATALYSAAFALTYAERDFEGGLALIERALALNPNLGAAWFVSGWVRTMNGDPEIAIAHFGRAARLSPFDPLLWGMQAGTALAHFLRGDYDEAASRARQVLRDRPNFLPAVCMLAASRALCGHVTEAHAAMARLRERGVCISLLKDRVMLRRSEDWAKFAEGLRLAGMGE